MMMMTAKKRRTSTVDVDESSNNNCVCWSDLPNDILESIMGKLFFADQINFRVVCKSWSLIDKVSPLKQMPWLMTFDDEENNHSWDSCKLVDPTYKKTYTIDMSSINKKTYTIDMSSINKAFDDEENNHSWDSCKLVDPTYKKRCTIDISFINEMINKKKNHCRSVKIHESKSGWLLMSTCVPNKDLTSSTSRSLFMYSPFIIDNNIIELPVLSTAHKCYIATFDLISKKNKEECFEVLVLSSDMNGGEGICIKTCRQGDNSWSCNETIWNFQFYMIKCWVYSEGIFYYATHLGRESGSYDIARNNWTKFPTLIPVQPINDLNMTLSDGKIYLISLNKTNKIWGWMYAYIYKLNLSKGIWEPIENLGDRALFLGDGYSSIFELDDGIEELNDLKQKLYYRFCCLVMHCNALGITRSNICSKDYGSFVGGKPFCRKLWIDPPRRIRNSL